MENSSAVSTKILTIGLVASALIGQGIAYKSLYLFHVLSLLFFAELLKRSGTKQVIQKLKSFTPLFGLTLFAVFSLLWRKDIKKAEIVYIYAILSILSSFILSSIATQISKKLALWAIIATTIGYIVIGLGEVTALFRYPLSIYSNMNWIAGRDYHTSVNPSVPTGFAWNPNDFSTIMCAILPLIISLPKSKFIRASLGLLVSFLIFLSGSRTGFIICMSELLCIIFFKVLAKKNTLKKRILIFLIGYFTILAVGWGTINSSEGLRGKISTLTQKKEIFLTPNIWGKLPIDSENIRLIWIDNLITAIKEKPLLGHGPAAANSPLIHKNFSRPVSPHAFIIEIIANFGVPWFVLLSLLYINLLIRLFRLGYHQSFFVSLIFLPLSSFSMSSCIFSIPLFSIIGISHGWLQTVTKSPKEIMNSRE